MLLDFEYDIDAGGHVPDKKSLSLSFIDPMQPLLVSNDDDEYYRV